MQLIVDDIWAKKQPLNCTLHYQNSKKVYATKRPEMKNEIHCFYRFLRDKIDVLFVSVLI